MILHGRNIIVKVDGVAIACARSCELSIDTDTIEVAHPTSGAFKKFIPARTSWSVTTGHLASTGATSVDNIRKMLSMARQTVSLEFSLKDYEGILKFKGDAIVTKGSVTGTLGNLGQSSFSFQGSGPLIDMNQTDYINGYLSFNLKEDGTIVDQRMDTRYLYLQYLDRYNTIATDYLVRADSYYEQGTTKTKLTHVRPAQPCLYTYPSSGASYYWDGKRLQQMESEVVTQSDEE